MRFMQAGYGEMCSRIIEKSLVGLFCADCTDCAYPSDLGSGTTLFGDMRKDLIPPLEWHSRYKP